MIEQEVRQAGVRVELVWVGVGVLGGSEGVDLVAADLEVLVRVPGMVSIDDVEGCVLFNLQLDLSLLGLALGLGTLRELSSLLGLLLLDLSKSMACPPQEVRPDKPLAASGASSARSWTPFHR